MGRKKKRPLDALPRGDVHGFPALSAAYLDWLRVRNYSEGTITGKQKVLRRFMDWCAERGITRPSEVTRPIAERYQRHLHYRRRADGRPISVATQLGTLMYLRGFFRWLVRQNLILYSPLADLELPRREVRLPQHILSHQDIERVLAQPDISEPLGLRDRAILETLYATGMRRTELCNLLLVGLDWERGTLVIRKGKGNKDRMVPLGERAGAWLSKYVLDVRPDYVVGEDTGYVFLNELGQPLHREYLTHRMGRYVRESGIGKGGSCHIFRHAMATQMLENGADIRFIQQMLGHTELTATQLYTHVAIRKLQEVHALTHPAAKLASPLALEDEAKAREQLLLALASEEDEENEASRNGDGDAD